MKFKTVKNRRIILYNLRSIFITKQDGEENTMSHLSENCNFYNHDLYWQQSLLKGLI